MKSEAAKFVAWLMFALLVVLGVSPACTPIQPALLPALPKPPAAQPPAATENQSVNQSEKPPVSAAEEKQWYPVGSFSGIANETTPAFHIYGTEWRLSWTLDAVDPETAVLNLSIYTKAEPFAVWQTVSNADRGTGVVNYLLSDVDKRDYFIKATAKNLRQWALTIEDNATAATTYPIQISSIHYKGTIFPADPAASCCTYERIEPDEYVVIKNLSSHSQDITGWTLKNISRPSPTFKFPPYIISPGEIVRVYTDEYHPETGGFNFNYGYGDVWDNFQPNIAVLYDALGNEVSRKSYATPINVEPYIRSHRD
jgi:hypothetical protein